MSKFNSRRVKFAGYSFDSKAEERRYHQLKLAQDAGTISRLMVHPTFTILDGFTDWEGKKVRPIIYEADFAYVEDGRFTLEDVKGFVTAEFRLKWKMLRARYPEYRCLIIDVKDL